MLDLRALREDPERFRVGLARRGAADRLDRLLELDAEQRALKVQVEELRAEQNRISKETGRAALEERAKLVEEGRHIAAKLGDLEPDLERTTGYLEELLAELPNLPDDSVPDGETEEDNEVLRTHGEPPSFDFEVRDHVALGESLRMIDVERGVRTSGSRFYYLTGAAVGLQFALLQYGLAFADRHGLFPMWTPALVRREAMYGTGFLPTDEAQIYVVREDDLYLIGTAEVTVASYHAGEILEAASLPIRYLGYSTCFRREAGTYGKDTRGVFRVHQFDKLEMFSFVSPDASRDEHERLLAIEEEWVQSLELSYRVVNVCIGELGASAAKKYDIEAWFPGQETYREVTSTSNTTDYQARRLGVRMRGEGGNTPVHTLNGTLCAISRTIICLMENHQQADGSIRVPEALHPYLTEEARVIRPQRYVDT
jgi:seryl-tRNA synthetase